MRCGSCPASGVNLVCRYSAERVRPSFGAGLNASAYARLVIVLRLAGGIESTKTRAQRDAHVVRCALLLPGSAVEERCTQTA